MRATTKLTLFQLNSFGLAPSSLGAQCQALRKWEEKIRKLNISMYWSGVSQYQRMHEEAVEALEQKTGVVEKLMKKIEDSKKTPEEEGKTEADFGEAVTRYTEEASLAAGRKRNLQEELKEAKKPVRFLVRQKESKEKEMAQAGKTLKSSRKVRRTRIRAITAKLNLSSLHFARRSAWMMLARSRQRRLVRRTRSLRSSSTTSRKPNNNSPTTPSIIKGTKFNFPNSYKTTKSPKKTSRKLDIGKTKSHPGSPTLKLSIRSSIRARTSWRCMAVAR